jgi:regulator of protease activity HflC (stomatin/prohibitin superfamily)
MTEFLNSINGMAATWVALVVIVILFIFRGIKYVPEGRTKIVERLGRRHKAINPGLNIIIPIIDKVKSSNVNLFTLVNEKKFPLLDETGITLAEQRMDPPSKKLLAKDNSEINVDPIVYFKIIDPIKLVYDVTDFAGSFETLIETTLRQEVGKYDGDTIVTSRDTLGDSLKKSLQEAGTAWGISIVRVEIEDIGFDKEVTRSLSDARNEELKRRAELVAKKAEAEQTILIAEAERKAEVLKAEGEKEARIRIAEAQFEEDKLQAEGQFLLESRKQEGVAQGFAAISQALKENPNSIVALESLKAQAAIANSLGNSSNTLIVPTETAGLFGAIGSISKVLEMISQSKSESPKSFNKNETENE